MTNYDSQPYQHDRSFETVGEYLPYTALRQLDREAASPYVGSVAVLETVEIRRSAGEQVAAYAGALAVHAIDRTATGIGAAADEFAQGMVAALPFVPEFAPVTARNPQYDLAA